MLPEMRGWQSCFVLGLAVKMYSSMEVCRGRLLVVKAEIHNRGFILINMYAPNTGRESGGFYLGVLDRIFHR